MPIIWILVISVILYLILRKLEKQHGLKSEKQSAPKPPTIEPNEAVTPVDSKTTHGKSIGGRPFIDTISGLPNETKMEFKRLNLTTPKAISDTPDKNLLALKGIGPARLKQIRAICADAKNPESEFVRQVTV